MKTQLVAVSVSVVLQPPAMKNPPQCHNPAHTPGPQESRSPACQISLATTWLSDIACAAECNTVT